MTKLYQVLSNEDQAKLWWIKRKRLEFKKKGMKIPVSIIQMLYQWHYVLNNARLSAALFSDSISEAVDAFENFSLINK